MLFCAGLPVPTGNDTKQEGGIVPNRKTGTDPSPGYLDDSGRGDRLSGGVRRIRIDTPHGEFSVWTRRFGNNPRLKLLLLHGGPGATHEYFEPCDSYLPAAGIEYYF
jgi:proline iminopeptidase